MGCGMSHQAVVHPELPNRDSEQFKDEFTISEVLGRGSFSTVWRAKDKKGSNDVALKMISKNRTNFRMKSIRRELGVTMKVSHPGCVGLLDFFQTEEKIVMVQELALGGDLHERICQTGAMKAKDAAFVLSQMLEAVGYLHKQNIAHRDLKPENIFMMSRNPQEVDYWVVKIGDFGLSTDEADGYKDVLTSVCGTPEFNAPEILKKAAGSKIKYSSKVDVWSLGAVLYTMLSASQPFSFRKGDPQQTFRRVCEGQYSFSGPNWSTVEKEAISVVVNMMNPSSEKRPTIEKCMELPWVAKWERKRWEEKALAQVTEELKARNLSEVKASDIVSLIDSSLDTEVSFKLRTPKQSTFEEMPVDWDKEMKQARSQQALEMLLAERLPHPSLAAGA